MMSAWAAQPAQSVNHRGVAGTGGGAAQKAIDANPAHDARIGIALRFAAIFPQAVALVLPDALQMRDELTSHGERFGRGFDAGARHEVKRIEQFTHHVGLTLCGRVITDTHAGRARRSGARKPSVMSLREKYRSSNGLRPEARRRSGP